MGFVEEKKSELGDRVFWSGRSCSPRPWRKQIQLWLHYLPENQRILRSMRTETHRKANPQADDFLKNKTPADIFRSDSVPASSFLYEVSASKCSSKNSMKTIATTTTDRPRPTPSKYDIDYGVVRAVRNSLPSAKRISYSWAMVATSQHKSYSRLNWRRRTLHVNGQALSAPRGSQIGSYSRWQF